MSSIMNKYLLSSAASIVAYAPVPEVSEEHMTEARRMVAAGEMDLDDYRGYFKDEYAKDSTLTDDELLAVIVAQGETENTDQEWAILMFDAQEEEEPANNQSPPAGHNIGMTGSIALRAAHAMEKANADTQFNVHLATTLDAAETKRRGETIVLFDWLRIYSEKDSKGKVKVVSITDPWPVSCELDAWPEPDSEEKNKDGSTNNNPDKYTIPNGRKNVKGELVDAKGSFYTDEYDASTEGLDTAKRIASVKAILDSIADARADCKFKEYQGMGDAELKGELNRLNTRRGNGATYFKQAMRLYNKIKDARGSLPKVTIRIVTTKDANGMDQVCRSPKCISVVSNSDPSKASQFTPSTLRTLDIDKAKGKPNGGEWDEVVTSFGKRKTKGGATGDGVKLVIAPAQVVSVLTSFYTFANDPKNSGDVAKLCTDETFVEISGDVRAWLNSLWAARPQLNKKYEAIQNREPAQKIA